MSSADLVDVAKCVQADLRNGQFLTLAGAPVGPGETTRIEASFDVRYGYTPRHKPSTLQEGEIIASVSPNAEQSQRLDRTSLQVDFLVDIALVGKLADRETETVDATMSVLQQVAMYGFDFGLSNGSATWIKNEAVIWPDRVQISETGFFFALWVATYRGIRKRRTE